MSASKDFNDLLYNVSRIYEGSKLKELRFLLNDHCDGSTLADKDRGAFDLFRELETKGYISNDPTDVKILLVTAEETETADASKLIKAFKKKYPNKEEDYKYTRNNPITPFRKKLLKVIKKNTNGVQSMDVIYKLGHVPFDSKWDFIFRLEQDCKLINTPDSLKEFAKCLSENASKILLDTSQPATLQSGTSQPGTSTEYPNTTRGASQDDETDNPAAATSTTPMETSI